MFGYEFTYIMPGIFGWAAPNAPNITRWIFPECSPAGWRGECSSLVSTSTWRLPVLTFFDTLAVAYGFVVVYFQAADSYSAQKSLART